MDPRKFNRLLLKIKYDKHAIEEIYTEYFPKIVMHITRRFGKLISPDDIAQEIFITLMTLEDFKPVDYPTSWIYRLADNKAIDKIRQQHTGIELTETYAAPFSLDNLILKEDVKKVLAKLDQDSQMIIYLHIWEGYEHKEIAQLLNLSYSNVRTKISRAYATIRKFL